jgi:hypothetical protein
MSEDEETKRLVREARNSYSGEFIRAGTDYSKQAAVNHSILNNIKSNLKTLIQHLYLHNMTVEKTEIERALERIQLIRDPARDNISILNEHRALSLKILNETFPPEGGRRMSYRSRKMKKHKKSKSHKKIKKGKRTKRIRY